MNTVWNVKMAEYGSPALRALLAAGWEPFGICCNLANEAMVILRKLFAEEAT